MMMTMRDDDSQMPSPIAVKSFCIKDYDDDKQTLNIIILCNIMVKTITGWIVVCQISCKKFT